MSTEGETPGDSAAAAPTGSARPNKWSDPGYLRAVQYATPANLAARQAIYAYQEPPVNLYEWALDLAGLGGAETILDVGCGNGAYLAALHRRGHQGLVVGTDFSTGMLSVARDAREPRDARDARDVRDVREVRGPEEAQPVVQGDAAALPFADGCADVVLAMHMLYHVPEPLRAVAEFRRVLRKGGRALILLNGKAHQRQLRTLLRETTLGFGEPDAGSASEAVDLDVGEELAARYFDVERHETGSELAVPDPAPVLAYVASMTFVPSDHVEETAILSAVGARVAAVIAAEGVFGITTSCGCLVCR